MRTDITIQSFYAGLILFGLCFLGMMINLGSFVVIISHFLPGLILGFLLSQNITRLVSNKRKVLFVISSAVIHVAAVFFVNVADNDEVGASIRLIIASSIGALLLSLVYDFILLFKVSNAHTLLMSIIIGFIASVFSAFCMYYIHVVDLERHILESFLWAGIFSIFPLWFYLFSRNIKIKSKEISEGRFSKPTLMDKM